MTVRQIERDYSENGEQRTALDALEKMGAIKDEGRFLDIGAGDGLHLSNTRALSDQGWRGVLVEADPRLFLRLLGNHHGNAKMECVLGAVVGLARQEGEQRPGISDGRLRPYYDGGEQRGWSVALTPGELALTVGSRFEFISIVGGATIDLALVKAMGPVLTHTRVVVFRDTSDDFMAAWREHGFVEVLRTNRSVILNRDKQWPGYGENGEKRGESVRAESVEVGKRNRLVWDKPAKTVKSKEEKAAEPSTLPHR